MLESLKAAFASPRLHISEHFSSIQGEGRTAGVPSIFWRFKGCVLECAWCDTLEVWKQGKAYSFEEAYAMFNDADYFVRLNEGKSSLVITGGDPLLQQDKIALFLQFCEKAGERVGHWIIEVENQASLMPKPEFANYVTQWNISPKLSNSGMPVEKRIVPEVIRYMVNHNSTFKFPIRGKEDMIELMDYVHEFKIPRTRVYLMPLSTTREEHQTVGANVAAIALDYGFRFSPRLQLVLWDKTVGV